MRVFFGGGRVSASFITVMCIMLLSKEIPSFYCLIRLVIQSVSHPAFLNRMEPKPVSFGSIWAGLGVKGDGEGF